MRHPLRSSPSPLCLVLLLTAGAMACGGSTTTETPGHGDGGTGHAKDGATTDAPGRTGPEGGGTCNLVRIVAPIVTVKDSTTGEAICDATAVTDGGLASLSPCEAGDGCTGTCPYTVEGLESSSAQTITVTAPDYGTATASVMNEYCGCGTTPCQGAQQVTISLVHGEGTDAGKKPKDAAPAPACPASEPTKGATCSIEGLECQYGTNPNPACDQVWECTTSHWSQTYVGNGCPPATTTCPSSYAAASARLACTQPDVRQLCDYSQGTCVCSADPGGLPLVGPPEWSCTPTTAGCPAAPPRLGTPCSADSGDDCDYGQCSGGVGISCTGGYWALANVACPA